VRGGEPPAARWYHRLAARVVYATRTVDHTFRLFERARSHVMVRLGSNAFFDAYNDLAYVREARYRPGSVAFRTDLFSWERDVIAGTFPPPPASVLIGAAGGGREALALAKLGYRVVAFDPARHLLESLSRVTPDGLELTVGRYEDLPVMSGLDGRVADLSSRPPFGASIVGWGSFSHLRSDDARVEALQHLARLTAGPVLVSFLLRAQDGRGGDTGARVSFSSSIGYYRLLTLDEVRRFGERAGLAVLVASDEGFPHVVFQRAHAPASR
jgi:hypothetical protein